tara:strand:+ start:157 stop:645 length:489 start_codon:yes stop_codon:yes gene_type:complete
MATGAAILGNTYSKHQLRKELAMSEAYQQPPPIPDFLNRSLWSPERWERHELRNKQAFERSRREINLVKRKAARELETLRIAKAEREQRRAANRQLKLDRKQRKAEKQADRDAVVSSIRLGHITLGQIAKATQRPPESLTRAIRWLLKNQRIFKASKRTYKL